MSSSKITTPSTHASAARISARSRLGRDRPRRSLVRTDRAIRVHADDQRVAKAARLLQIAQVADVQQIEDTVGEDDRLPRRPQALDERATASLASGMLAVDGFAERA